MMAAKKRKSQNENSYIGFAAENLFGSGKLSSDLLYRVSSFTQDRFQSFVNGPMHSLCLRERSLSLQSNAISNIDLSDTKLLSTKPPFTLCVLTSLLSRLNCITPARPRELTRLKKNQRTVSRTYGGCLSPNAVKERIIRSFLLEEQKIVSKVLKSRRGAE
ncbi:unnamed protein product [Cylicostephanus goldi]|uniref:Large ribosomal subunit protein eL34 n=1 Tax=Cylicostephanus goldi TaxID=71465 RepID=A0A3P7QAM1_CYLGO|nr:unnamed protein product [Cylicostephanus goldi]